MKVYSTPVGLCHVGAETRRLAMALAALTAAALLGGIYPKGHWKSVTKCTTSNFDGLVKEQVDSGKTLFVRWIASEG